jgi:hypothetical protein
MITTMSLALIPRQSWEAIIQMDALEYSHVEKHFLRAKLFYEDKVPVSLTLSTIKPKSGRIMRRKTKEATI